MIDYEKKRMAIRFKIEDMLQGYELELQRHWHDHTYEIPNRIDFIYRILDLFEPEKEKQALNIEDLKADEVFRLNSIADKIKKITIPNYEKD